MKKIIRTCCQSSHCECGVLVQGDDGRITKITGDPQHPSTKGFVCVKAQAQLQLIDHADRLRHPLKRVGERGSGKWERISWDEALSGIAEKFEKIREAYSPESIATIHGTGPRSSTPATTLLAHALGSPNVISTDLHICFAPSTLVGVCTFGQSVMMEVGPDYLAAECILVWGANPMASHGPRGRGIVEAKKRGGRLIVVDPPPIPLAKQ